jgi:DNA-binding winged helix-turn-helix (wHTH) protein/predicted ATPase
MSIGDTGVVALPALVADTIPLSAETDDLIAFGPYRLSIGRQILRHGSRQIRLGSRAMAILIALVERAGDLITKEELVRIVWPQTFVEDVNLRVHIAALRRELGDDRRNPTYIANFAGRGYCFVAPISRSGTSRPQMVANPPEPIGQLLPSRGRFGLIGAESAVQRICDLLQQNRLVTVVGPPGAGKSTLALEAAIRASATFPAGVHVVNLSGVASDTQGSTDAAARILAWAGTTTTAGGCLIVVDGCDQIVLPVARAVEVALRRHPDLRILATSTELLRAEGEFAHHVCGLGVPDRTADVVAIRQAPAVRLFLERAAAAGWAEEPSSTDLSRIANLTQQLDGNPQAIELAAVGAMQMGLAGVLGRVEKSLSRQTHGGTGPFSTTHALLNWSVAALSPVDLRVLRCLSVFATGFTLDQACAVINEETLTPQHLTETIYRLLEMSLLANVFPDPPGLLHMPNVVKAICHQDLARNADENAVIRCRHAKHVLASLADIAQVISVSTAKGDRTRFESLFAEVQVALATAAALPDPTLYADLARLALPLGLAIGYIGELQGHAETAFCRLAQAPGHHAARYSELALALALLELPLKGVSGPVLARLEQAVTFANPTSQTYGQAVLGTATAALLSGDFGRARLLVDQAGGALEQFDPDRRQLFEVDAIVAAADHGHGASKLALDHALTLIRAGPSVLRHKTDPHRRDLRIGMRIIAARSHWILGQADQARLAVSEALGYAGEENALALCQTLGWAACPVLILCGDDTGATQHVRRLRMEADRAMIPYWQGWATVFEYIIKSLAAREGRANRIAAPPTCDPIQKQTIVTLTGEYGAYASSFVNDAQGWCAPELIRLNGIQLAQEKIDPPLHKIRQRFKQAYALAGRQGALAWQLRAAISLARYPEQGRASQALSLLKDVYGRFAEGHQTSDMIVARSMLRDGNTRGLRD